MNANVYGQAIVHSNELLNLLLEGKNIGHLNVVEDEEITLYKQYQELLLSNTTVFLDIPDEKLSVEEFHKKSAQEWLLPLEFQTINVYNWLLAKCKTEEEIDRVKEEYILFEERELVMLLRLFIYLVEYMRKNELIWGVGRGSSVSSFCLYLIGIHRVNSLKFGLDIKDFLK